MQQLLLISYVKQIQVFKIKQHLIRITFCCSSMDDVNVSMFHVSDMCLQSRKGGKIWNRYNQVPHLTQDTVWESDKYKKNQIYESQEVSIFTAGDHKAE